MKCRMKRVASLFLALALCAGMTMNVGAVTVQEAENKADELEGKKKEQAEAEAKDLTEKLKGIVADMEETQKKLTEKKKRRSNRLKMNLFRLRLMRMISMRE